MSGISGIQERTQALQLIMSKLLSSLKIKDAYGLFLEPVDTEQVSDYLTIIKNPMDLGTIEQKLSIYKNLREFQNDVELVCSNAMTYNAPNTIYYKNAQKLLDFARRAISRETQKWNERLNKESKQQFKRSHRFTDDYSLTSHYDDVPSKKKVALHKRAPDGTFSFSTKPRLPLQIFTDSDGSIALSNDILTPEHLYKVLLNPFHEGHMKISYSLGASSQILTQQIISSSNRQHNRSLSNQPTPGLIEFQEPWFSFCPFYESSPAATPPFDSVAYALAYGDPKGKAYIESMNRFISSVIDSKDHHLYNLINNLTLGGHAYIEQIQKWKEEFQARKKSSENEIIKESSGDPLTDQVRNDLNQLARLLRWKRIEPEIEKLSRTSSIPIIKQFLAQSSLNDKQFENIDVGSSLDHCSKLIISLQALQNDRFKLGGKSSIAEEKQLIQELRGHLVLLASIVLPKDLTSNDSINQTMKILTGAPNAPLYNGVIKNERQ